MEKIYGTTLDNYISQALGNRPIDVRLAIEWFKEIVTILDRVHQENLFHRDIKPSNIMLTSEGKLVLIDFGGIREQSHTYKAKV